MLTLARAVGCMAFIAMMQSFSASASPEHVCALISPFFVDPPQRFISQRGPTSSKDVWKAKANADADALNAACDLNTYGGEGTYNFWCTIQFEDDKLVDQTNLYEQAVLGIDYCISKLSFGDEWTRTVGQTVGRNLDTNSTSWYKRKDKEQFHFAVDAHHFKNPGSRDVKISVEYQRR
jgi:hypothetical protein